MQLLGLLLSIVLSSTSAVDDRAFVPQRPEFEKIARALEAGFNEFLGEGQIAAVEARLASKFDGDAYLDVLVTRYDPSVPPSLYRNNADGTLEDRSTASRLDVQLGGFYPGDRFKNVLFENPGAPARHLYVQIVGTQSNRGGVGARIAVEIETPAGKRTLHRAVGSVSSLGGSPLRQEIGVGDATAIRSLTVRWPRSGIVQTFGDLSFDSFVRVTERLLPDSLSARGAAATRAGRCRR